MKNSLGEKENLRSVAAEMLKNGTELCNGRNPIGINCATTDGQPWYMTGEKFVHRCTVNDGIECKDADNSNGCSDYAIQFLCPLEQVRTEAPITPFDSCSGVTCSGNGQCIPSADGYICDCLGFFGRDCEQRPIRVLAVNNVSECGGVAPHISSNDACHAFPSMYASTMCAQWCATVLCTC